MIRYNSIHRYDTFRRILPKEKRRNILINLNNDNEDLYSLLHNSSSLLFSFPSVTTAGVIVGLAIDESTVLIVGLFETSKEEEEGGVVSIPLTNAKRPLLRGNTIASCGHGQPPNCVRR